MNKQFRFVRSVRIPAALALVTGVGMANAAVDVSAITGSATEIATVGAAVFAVAIGIKLFKWIRRAL